MSRFHLPTYMRPRSGGNYTPPPEPKPALRIFFECSECEHFHESALILNCDALSNRFRLQDIPCGDGSDTEVHYLDGHIERTPMFVRPVPAEDVVQPRRRRR